MRKCLPALVLMVALLPLAVTAQVYRYVDEKGVVHYTDKAPNKDAKPIVVPKVQTYPAGETPRLPSSSPAPAAVQGAYTVNIISPLPEQTFRDPGAAVAVAASVAPELAEGHGLMFYVDGAPASSAPASSAAFTLEGLERGTHSVAAAVVDAQGKELARSPSVQIHLLLPGVNRPAARRAQ